MKLFLVALTVVILAACGKGSESNQSAPLPASPQPTPVGSGSGGTTVQNPITDPGTGTGTTYSCVTEPKAGSLAFHRGPQAPDKPFTDPDKQYLGTIVEFYGDATVKVSWADGITRNPVKYADIAVEGKCSPDLKDKRMKHISTHKTGKVVRWFGGGTSNPANHLEIDWDDVGLENSLVPWADLTPVL